MDRADNQTPDLFGQTPWQTLGPFFHYALPWRGGADLVDASDLGARPDLVPPGHDHLNRAGARASTPGEVIEITGKVLDGEGQPVPDALVEIWQADPEGAFASGGDFVGFGRCATGEDGAFRFRTLRPGRVMGPGNILQAAHIAVGVMARGLITRLVTRIYFADGEGLDLDPILGLTPEARRETLLARPRGEGRYGFDIVLQGEDETVFFDF